MKLLNYTSLYISAILLVVITIWAVIFYFTMLDEVYEGLDDTLKQNAELVILNAELDSSILNKKGFQTENYSISKGTNTDPEYKKYQSVEMFLPFENKTEEVRLHTKYFELNGVSYELQMVNSLVETDDILENMTQSLIWLYVSLIVLLLLLNNIILQKLWMPFYRITKRLQQFRFDRNQAFDDIKTNIKEFNDLNTSVNTLLKRNIEIYNSQKQFIENAAHELQTPLGSVINRIELLIENTECSAEQLQMLSTVLDSLEKLNRLNRSLLLLSKIENKQYEEKQEINVNGLIKNISDELYEQLEYKEIKLTIIEKEICKIVMHNGLAQILFTNLIKNAIVHNYRSGKIEIIINLTFIEIINTGKASSLNNQELFTRFYKESSDNNSTGLGLAIVKAISDASNIDISYSFNGNHRMKINFEKIVL